MQKYRENFYSGLSGLQLPIPKYQYPQEFQLTSRLTYYASLFNSIEINSCFYKIPMKATVARWCSSVNDGFRFTFKLFKDVTHCKNLNFSEADIAAFLRAVSGSGLKKGLLLVQFPPSLTSGNIHQLEKLLAGIKSADPENEWTIATEFRDRSWYHDDVYDLLNVYRTALVRQDIPKSATPFTALVESSTIYVRFHGPTGNYRGSYSDVFLMEYAEYVKEWLREGKTVYVYFNNTAGDAYNNLVTFNKLVL
jgi:uncharacterized protein YecE (DUF72 family)